MTATVDGPTAAPTTRPGARKVAMTVYAVLLLVWCWLVGNPNDEVGVILWAWLGAVAWNIDTPRETARDFLHDWWLPVLLLVIYWFARGMVDDVGLLPVHFQMPITVDEWLGGGVTPTERLQDAWCGDPCLKTDPPRWFDIFFTSVYASHFLVALTLAGILWIRDRAEWLLWMRRFIVLKFVGVTIYWLYPMAPPWMASQNGLIGEAHRITSRGWSEIDLHRQTMVLFGMGNKTAAMPSLHAGIAFLVVFYAIWRLRSPLRWLLLLYPVAMSVALVYFAEHYVVDVVAGAIVAGAVMVGVKMWEDRRAAAYAASA